MPKDLVVKGHKDASIGARTPYADDDDGERMEQRYVDYRGKRQSSYITQHDSDRGLRYLREPTYSKALLSASSQASLHGQTAGPPEGQDRKEMMVQASMDDLGAIEEQQLPI